MKEYEFQSSWILSSDPPISGTRCIVTDGELVMFATYVCDHENLGTWVLTGVEATLPFSVIAWMPSPKPFKKSIPYDDKNLAKV